MTLSVNPYLSEIASYVESVRSSGLFSLTEHELLTHLRRTGHVPPEVMSSHPLYCIHFLMRNALYQLAEADAIGHWCFSPVGVEWTPRSELTSNQSALSEPYVGHLACYYLDMNNLDLDDAAVDQLLDGFWRKYQKYQKQYGDEVCADRQAALALLELERVENLAALKLQYRRQVMANHPDRGGSKEKMQALNGAFTLLKRSLG